MIRMRRMLGVCVLGGLGCGGQPDSPAPRVYEEKTYDLRIWPTSLELETNAIYAALRIATATGLKVDVGESLNGLPMFWESRADTGWYGVTHYDVQRDPTFIAIADDTPDELLETIVLHEMLHALGGQHIGIGAGVLSPDIWAPMSLTIDDLVSVCAVSECKRLQVETL